MSYKNKEDKLETDNDYQLHKDNDLLTMSVHNKDEHHNYIETGKENSTFFKKILSKIWKRLLILFDIFGWIIIILPLGVIVGTVCGLFKYSMFYLTNLRYDNPWIIYLLPLSGLVQALIYKSQIGNEVNAGFDLVLENIYLRKEFDDYIPIKMGPIVIICTLLSQMTGACIGGEGLQIGPACSSLWIHILKFISRNKFPYIKLEGDLIVVSGLGASFAGIIGTPLGGTIFAIEVLNVGKINTNKVFPTLVASVVSDYVTREVLKLFGIAQLELIILKEQFPLRYDYMIVIYAIIIAIFCGWAAFLYAFLIKLLKKSFEIISKYIISVINKSLTSNQLAIGCITGVIGGSLTLSSVFILNTDVYLGVGTIKNQNDPNNFILQSFFFNPNTPKEAFIIKIILTSICNSSGFKGGDIANLFYIGAALGNLIGQVFGREYSYFAGLGVIGVFAGATNTPISCILIGMDLFGGDFVVIYGVVSFISYIVSGWIGIYSKQNVYSVKLFPIFNINSKKEKAERIERRTFQIMSHDKILTHDKIEK